MFERHNEILCERLTRRIAMGEAAENGGRMHVD